MKTLLKTSILGFVAALLSCGSLSAADSMTDSLRSLKGAEFEQGFLTQMIEHHHQGIEMAKMVPHHTKRAELTEFAEKMTKTQMMDIEQMSALLKSPASANGKKMDHSMMGDKKMDHGKMDGMKMPGMAQMESAQGSDFDRAFVQEMIKHHTMALDMSQLADERATRTEVREMAKKITKEQKGEIKKLNSWQAKWFK